MRHQAQLDQPVSKKDPGLGTVRAHLTALADRGVSSATERLEGPDAPEDLEYLLALADEFQQGLGANQGGVPEARWVDLQAWTAMTGRTLESEEARALVLIIGVRHCPGDAPAEATE